MTVISPVADKAASGPGGGISILLRAVFLLFSLVGCNAGLGGKPNCDIQSGPCILATPECTVTLDIRPRPVKAMQLHSFRVVVDGRKPDSSPVIHLDMPGMTMGTNMVRLKPSGENAYEGQGIIVRCTSGSRLWRAMVILPGICRVDFLFEVMH